MYGKLCASLVGALALAIACNGQMAYDHGKIVACYYSSWAYYRPGIGAFDVDDIDPTLCSHGFYGFADLNNITWTIDAIDINFDYCPEDCSEDEVCQYCGFKRFVELKQKNADFIPMLSIGGWNAGSGEYSLMAADPESMDTFVKSVVPYLQRWGFEGLDVDWEYPGSREGADDENDMDNFSELIRALSDELHAEGMLLTGAMAAGYQNADLAYDMPALVDYFDFFNIMCYDYHGWFPNHEFTGHNAPLRGYEDEDNADHPGYRFNHMATVEYYLDFDVPVEKMVIGSPTYGRGFQIVDPENNGLYCPADNGLPMGPYTRQMGHYGYLEVLQLFNNDTGSYTFMPEAEQDMWVVHVDDCYHAPYVTNGPYWLGYDDPDSLEVKVKYANFLGAGGVMVWSIETDDFGAYYSGVTYPLLRRMNEVLLSGETYDPSSDADLCVNTPDDWCDILGDLAELCTEENEQLPYPGGCHDYYRCILVEGDDTPDDPDDDIFEVSKFSCGNDVYDPVASSCIDPNLPGTSNLCDRVD